MTRPPSTAGPLALFKKPAYRRLQQAFQDAAQNGLGNPFFATHDAVAGATTQIAGQQLVNFGSYNYLGMSGDPYVSERALGAIQQFGTSVSASRLVSGEIPLHRKLDDALARFQGAEAAVTFVSGHATNVTVIGHLLGPRDLVLHDAMAHNSIVQGCVLSGAERRTFAHNDPDACATLLQELRGKYRHVLIAIEGVYSMDGDIADLPKFVEIKRQFDAALLVDEAHSLGTIGTHGRGLTEHFDVEPSEVDLTIGTLSKSLGSCGGYVAGARDVVEYLKYTAPGFVFSVGMAPSNAAAAHASLELIEKQPQRVRQLQARAELFLDLANRAGLDTGTSRGTPIVPIIVGSAAGTLQLAERLLGRGINVAPILPPAVAERGSRLRFFLAADHTETQIRQTVQAVSEELRTLTTQSAA